MERRTLVVEQPNYIPWLGYFDLMAQSDVWVWYDDVQYTRRDWRNRNRIAGDAEPHWLTVPVKSKGRYDQKIADVEIDDAQPWAAKHLRSFRHCYSRAPYFTEVLGILRTSLEAGHRFLADLTIELNEALCRHLGFGPRFVRSSTLVGLSGDRQERLVEICRHLGATSYLSGPAARADIAPKAFWSAGIELRYMVYEYPPYDRCGRPFVPQLSVLDPLAWMGASRTAAFLAAHGGSAPEVAGARLA